MADLVEVLNTPSVVEARLAAAGLRDVGIEPTVLGEHLASVLGAGTMAIPCRVMVSADDRELAQGTLELMREAARKPSSEGHPEACPDCGAPWEQGFDVCWRCDAGHGGADPEGAEEVLPRIQIDLDAVTATLPRPAHGSDIALLLASPLPIVVAALAAPELVFGSVLLSGLMLFGAWANSRRTTAVRIDGHALTVNQERVLWEDVHAVIFSDGQISWRTNAGLAGAAEAKFTPQEQEILDASVRDQLARPRGPRDREGEAAVRTLLDR